MKCKALITARAFWASGAAARKLLEAHHCALVDPRETGPHPTGRITELLGDCDGVIAGSDSYNASVFSACPNLKVVSRCGVGIDSVDLDDATRAGVMVTNTPGAMTDAVADYTFALLLGITRNIPQGDTMMRTGGWKESPGVLVWGKTLGLIGFGQIGQGVARRAGGFKMRILAFDPPMEERLRAAAVNAEPHEFSEVEFVTLERLFEESDFVSVHAPSTPETRHLVNASRIRRMKPTAYLVNTARGALVDQEALFEALEAGAIAGAALDVFEQEPLPADHPLRHAPRTLLTPHNAFNAVEAAAEMSRQSAENLLSALRGERPPSLCNPEVWDSPALRVNRRAIKG